METFIFQILFAKLYVHRHNYERPSGNVEENNDILEN